MNIIGFYVDKKLVDLCAWLGFGFFFMLPWCLGIVQIVKNTIMKGK